LHVAILGNGVTGVSAALELRARRPDWRITLVSGESTHHWSRPALMYVFMGHMRYADTKPFEDSFWGRQRLELQRGWVTRIDTARKRLELHDKPPLSYDTLLVATGSKPNRFGWPGQDLAGVQGLYGLQDLKLLYENVEHARRAVIVGGGLIGIELAEMLHSRGLHVTFLVREPSYWSNVLPLRESDMVNRLIRSHGMELLLSSELERIEDDGRGRVRAVRTKAGQRIECELVGLTAGVSPNLDALAGSGIETGRGVLVDGRLRTSDPCVFAAGDCAEIRARDGGKGTIQQVWYTGKKQGEFVARVIAGDEQGEYDPGIWFNSAKFLDLEYQTYGRVEAEKPQPSLYWEHEDGLHALRIAHEGTGVVGFNTMGVRWRHEVCERWIRERASPRDVLARLEEAWFEPELFRRHEPAMRRALAGAL
jgi:NADPH-dependent 2,4-dienoyl-CoA reductase/sulfur reductase-like enzyme